MATSWPLPPWFLTGKRSVWCFLFVTLFNLQGTRRFRRNIAIIHDFIPFVKNFFRKFLTFLPVRRCTHQFLLYHTLERLSRSFSTFFIRSVAAYQRQLLDCNTLSCACQQLFEFLQASVGRAAHLADSLVRIPDPFPGFFCTLHCSPIIPDAKEPFLFPSPLSFILVLLP